MQYISQVSEDVTDTYTDLTLYYKSETTQKDERVNTGTTVFLHVISR